MSVEDQLAELRTYISTLTGRRVFDHPTYRAWVENSAFSVGGQIYNSDGFIAQSVTMLVNSDGRLLIDPPLRSHPSSDLFYAPRGVRCVIYGLTCVVPSMRVTIAYGAGRNRCVCEGGDLPVGQFIRPIVLPELMDYQLLLRSNDGRSSSSGMVTVMLHTLINDRCHLE